MSATFLSIHPDNPQSRFIKQVCNVLQDGGVVVLPTDSSYALCCMLDQKKAMEQIARIRQVDKYHNFTLLCRDLSEISTYAKVDNSVFRLLKNNTPGAYTFILPATKEVPRRLMNEKRKTIGIRIPKNAVIDSIVEELNEPIMSCTLIMPGKEEAESDSVTINSEIGNQVDLIVDCGQIAPNMTTVVSFEDGVASVVRYGAGDASAFE